MREFMRGIVSTFLGKMLILAILAITGAIIDVQVLKAKVTKIEINGTIERQILCKVAHKVSAFDDKDDNLCLELIR